MKTNTRTVDGSRRRFLAASVAAGAGVLLSPTRAGAQKIFQARADAGCCYDAAVSPGHRQRSNPLP